MPRIQDYAIGAAFGASDYVLADVNVAGTQTTQRIPKSLLGTGVSVATTRSGLKGDNAGNAIALTRTPIADVNYAILLSDNFVAYSTLTAARIPTLPAANAFPVGCPLVIADESGNCNGTNTLTITRGGSDTIQGATTMVLNTAYAVAVLYSDGVSKWSAFKPPPASATTVASTRAVLKGDNAGNAVAVVRTPIADVNYTILVTDNLVAYSTLTAARVPTLPAASAYAPGSPLVIVDESGSCSATNTLTITRAGSDTIDGATTLVLKSPYAIATLYSDGVSKWIYHKTGIGQKGVTDGSAAAAGEIGEIISASLASGSAIALTTGVNANIVSISLTAGDWDVSGVVGVLPAGTTSLSALIGGAGNVSAVLPGENILLSRFAAFVSGAFTTILPIPTIQWSLSATTTIFLVMQAGFTVSTCGGFGTIRARRIR